MTIIDDIPVTNQDGMTLEEVEDRYDNQLCVSSYQYFPMMPEPLKPPIILPEDYDYYSDLSERVLHKMGMTYPEPDIVKQLGHAIEESEREIKSGLA